MKWKPPQAILIATFILLLYGNSVYPMFGPNEGKDIGKEAAEKVATGMENLLATASNTFTPELKNIGKNAGQVAAKEITEAIKNLDNTIDKLVKGTITSKSSIHITVDPEILKLTQDVWVYIKKRGSRIAGGLTLMAGGVFMIVDGVRRIAETEVGNIDKKITYKIIEAVTGLIMTGSGLYLVLA
ncbi:hypothetical protein KC460_01390 [Candidatus Dependentiae bacterium]|nr:hypothetical protein [Candidatus Dependentiae bacterium]